MSTNNQVRRGGALLAAVVLAVAGAGMVTAPAQAQTAPERVEQPSAHDSTPAKTATVTCPDGRSVFAAGARVFGGHGRVVLTAMVPDPGLTLVSVAASARTGYAGAWSVVAFAICDQSVSPPGRVAAMTMGARTATATCPAGTHLTGTGFRIQGPVDGSHLDEVAISATLQQVRVHVGGPDIPGTVTSYAICKPPTSWSVDRVAAMTGSDASWPKAVAVGDSSFQRPIYGVGATVTGGGGQAFLTGLVPDLDQNRAVAVAERALPPAVGPAAIRAALAGEEDGSVTVYGILIGTFY